jgi:hypothetical protein
MSLPFVLILIIAIVRMYRKGFSILPFIAIILCALMIVMTMFMSKMNK